MLKKAITATGIALTAVTMSMGSAAALGNADGNATSVQGPGGTNTTGTFGNHSPNFHTADNPNICLPEVHHVQVGLVPVQADVPILNQQQHQICNVGHTTQGEGDGALSHLIG
ncbi:rodlet layer protein [Streptacidiphilus sp. PAMC 29251]